MSIPLNGYLRSWADFSRGVDLVFSRLSTESFARKRVLRSRSTEQSQHFLIQELRELRRLRHRHLVRIIGSYTDIEYIAYLMKPVAESTLADFLSGHSALKNSHKIVLRRLYGCLAGAMNYLYTKNVRHRDLTARNILIDAAGEVYISDFGSAYNWTSRPTSKTKHRNVPTSPDYMAPELARGGEHGTKSDMWSLGIVYLEMTSRLLGYSASELRRKIKEHCYKTREPPFPYAHMPIVNGWMQKLGNTSADFDHDKEPLSWIKELLHFEHEHRPTPPQLMKYIHESPSFGIFCCIKCHDEFQDERFAYEQATLSQRDTRDNSKQTKEEVQALFEEDPAKQTYVGMSSAKADSINRWLTADYAPSHFGLPPTAAPGLPFNNGPRDDDVRSTVFVDMDPVQAQHFLFDTYEHATGTAIGTGFFSVPSRISEEPEDKSEADTTLKYQETRDPLEANDEKRLQDSGLGFQEFETDSEDDVNPLNPFDEFSDRSSNDSSKEDGSTIGFPDEPFQSSPSEIEDHQAADPDPEASQEQENDFMFEEEEDVSDGETFRSQGPNKPEAQDRDRVDEEIDERQSQGPDQVSKPTAPIPSRVQKELKQARISEYVEYIPNPEPEPIFHKEKRAIPEIMIEPLGQPGQPWTSEEPRSPITPRKREPIVPINVQRLINNTWESASSAPTSVLSEETRSTLSRLLFLVPSDQQIEQVLIKHCKAGQAAAVKLILSKVVSPSRGLKKGQYLLPLIHAIKGGSKRHNKCVRELLGAGVDPNRLYRAKPCSQTPLHLALAQDPFKGYANLIWLLLSHKADPNKPDRNGEVPLAKLFLDDRNSPLPSHKRGALIMLLKEGAKPDFTLPGTGDTLLHLAVRRQDAVAVAMLLHAGADVNKRNYSGSTPLQITAGQFAGCSGYELGAGHAEVLEHLLQAPGVEVDATAGMLKRTALHWAVVAGCAQAVVRLVEAWAGVEVRDAEGRDAVMLAVKFVDKVLVVGEDGEYTAAGLSAHVEIMNALIEAGGEGWPGNGNERRCGVEVAARDEEGWKMKRLLDAGLDPMKKFRGGTIREFVMREGSDAARAVLTKFEGE